MPDDRLLNASVAFMVIVVVKDTLLYESALIGCLVVVAWGVSRSAGCNLALNISG